ncbi:MAG TPA: LLM class flavin-dependent oxidoreductase [Methylomirabilota bacterium]|jgi:alkanesulfonate monooxygenase SsuD/methylene tetrahydromethanopterin reductase-like flavin-dependent oxidoreductase (luciferase family)
MRFSICVMADVDEIGFFSHAESLGYDSVWVTDSQMLFSDCYAVLALAAQQTRRIRLGPGVAICGTRIPPVHVAAMATLNRIAPGRVHLGVGTGNTATRSMGQPPMRIAEYDEYLRVLRDLLRGEAVDYSQHGARPGAMRPIKMLIREKKYMSLEPRIPLYVSAFGPRAMELAGEHGDGVVFAIPPRGIAPAEALAHCRAGAARAGRTLDERFHTCALTNIVLLDPGEPADSERVIRTVGPNVMASVYYFYDRVHERGMDPPPFLRRIWSRYCALVEEVPREHRHFRTHEGHYTYLHPGEAELIDGDLVRATCLVGEADELIVRIRDLERGGLRELMFATGVDEKWRFSRELARRVMERY